MTKVRAILALLAALLGGAVLVAPSAQAATVTTTLRAGISGLPVATEVRTGYSRDKFTLWTDADGDGCNTRYEVLIAEAWDSGARTWTAAQRTAYANDLGDNRALVAVTDNVNQAKGDKDPAEWMPSYSGATCRYVAEWLAVKLRWRLTVNTAERNALTSLAAGCTNISITVTRAL